MSTRKQTYRIPLVWQEYGHINVEAESVEEAIDYALGPECPLPEGSYVDESVEVDYAALEADVQPTPTQSEDCDDSSYGAKHWRNRRTGHRTFSWYTAMQWATDGDDVEAWLPDGLSEVIKGDHTASKNDYF